jgi:hypothetical protein
VRTIASVVEQSMHFAAGQPVAQSAAVELANGVLAELAAARVRFIAVMAGVVLCVGLGVGGFAVTANRNPPPASDPTAATTPLARPAEVVQPPPKPGPRPEAVPPGMDAPPVPGATFMALLRGVEPGPRTATLRVREVETTYPLTASA